MSLESGFPRQVRSSDQDRIARLALEVAGGSPEAVELLRQRLAAKRSGAGSVGISGVLGSELQAGMSDIVTIAGCIPRQQCWETSPEDAVSAQVARLGGLPLQACMSDWSGHVDSIRDVFGAGANTIVVGS